MHPSFAQYVSRSLSYLLRPLSEETEEPEEPESCLFLSELDGEEEYSGEEVARLMRMQRLEPASNPDLPNRLNLRQRP
jgi:hypothetical protein